MFAIVHFPESDRVVFYRVDSDDFSNEREMMSCSYEEYVSGYGRMRVCGDGNVMFIRRNGREMIDLL